MNDELVYEIAYFNLNEGTSDKDVVEAAEKIQRYFLSKFSGIVYRELLKDQSGLWMDTVHWESVGDYRKAAQAVLVDPAATPLMELIDFTSTAWFHAFRARHWAKRTVPQGTGFTDLSLFRLVEVGAEEEGLVPATAEEFLESVDQSQRFIEDCEGFVDREIFKTRDGWWLDLMHWGTERAAERARQSISRALRAEEPRISSLKAKIDPKSLKVFHLEQMKVWVTDSKG